jgi:predicted AAA+ superfamily ATPase
MQQGLTESLAGRFEVVQLPHWSLAEMRAAFGFSLEQYLYFGGYPGAAPLIKDPQRWRRYLLDALIETTISRDVLLMTRVDKPTLLRRLFELGCRYSGRVLSYIRQRRSSPKLQVMNTALMTAQVRPLTRRSAGRPRVSRRLVESAVGAHLANAAEGGACELFYWRERNREVDFVVRAGRTVVAIEVKSDRAPGAFPGLGAFTEAFKPKRALLVGGDGTRWKSS